MYERIGRGIKMADTEEIIRIDSRNNLHLSPSFLNALNVRAGDSVVATMEGGKRFVVIRKKEATG